MAFNPQSTLNIAQNGIKIALFGESGVGKTWQISTLRRPFVISTEGGLLTLVRSGKDIPYVEVRTVEELKEARLALDSDEYFDTYDTVVIDSVSELADLHMMKIKGEGKAKGWDTYTQTQDIVNEELRTFFSLATEGKDIVMIFKLGRIEDKDTGRVAYSPFINSSNFSSKIPYLFNEVLAIRAQKTADKEGNPYIDRWIQCANDGRWACKDQSGYLADEEYADLGYIIDKIRNKGEEENAEE